MVNNTSLGYKNDVYHARCKVCSKNISVAGQGVIQKGKKHLLRVPNKERKLNLKTNESDKNTTEFSSSKPSSIFSVTEKTVI